MVNDGARRRKGRGLLEQVVKMGEKRFDYRYQVRKMKLWVGLWVGYHF